MGVFPSSHFCWVSARFFCYTDRDASKPYRFRSSKQVAGIVFRMEPSNKTLRRWISLKRLTVVFWSLFTIFVATRKLVVIFTMSSQDSYVYSALQEFKSSGEHTNRAVDRVPQKSAYATSELGLPEEMIHGVKNSREAGKDPFVVADFCAECLSALINPGLSCGERISHLQKTNNMTLSEAMNNVASHFPVCSRCSEKNCTETLWRMDDVAPRTLYAQTPYLQSIGSENRLPRDALSDLDGYFSKKENVSPNRSYYFEYNPSIVQIPQDQIPDIDGEIPVYLASFRITNTQQCISGEQELAMIGGSWPRPKSVELLGLAILRKDLTVIQDIVVDLHSAGVRPQDYRLFVLNNTIYVSTFDYILPLWLVAPDDMKDKKELPQKYEVATSMRVYARTYPSCCPFHKNRKLQKNLNYFVEKNNVMVERKPMGAKWRMDLEGRCQTKEVKPKDPPIPPPQPSFKTSDELYLVTNGLYLSKKSYTEERGSACCVSLTGPDGEDLMLGISHSKTKVQGKKSRTPLKSGWEANEFFSSFYVMKREAPYNVVARSGRFCLGFGSEEEQRTNPFVLSNMKPLVIGETYNCPKIHFVSGMVEKANDPSRVIIAYGVNDCTGRFVEVSKASIYDMLFRPLKMNAVHGEAA